MNAEQNRALHGFKGSRPSRRLNFCFVTTFYPPYNFGGDGIFVERLAEALARDGHQVEVVHDADAFEALAGRRPLPSRPHVPNLEVRALRGGLLARVDLLASHQLGRPVAKARELRSRLAAGRYDVIHFHNVSLIGGPRVLCYGDAVKICTLHDYWFVCPMHVLWRYDRERCTRRTCLSCCLAGRRPPQFWRRSQALGRALAEVDAFLAPSETSRKLHLDNGFPAPIRVLPHFADDGAVAPLPDSAGPPLPGRPFFLYVGRLEKLKGIERLVERFQAYRDASLVIAGAGTREAKLREMARGFDHIHLLGWVDRISLRRLYREALAVVVPSLCYETFGLPVVEGFAAGTPAVVSAGGAAEELVAPNRAGIVYRSDAELITALEGLRTRPELRRELGENARRIFEAKFTEEKHLEAYYALIAQLKAGTASQQSA